MLSSEVHKSQTYLDRVRNAEVVEVTGGMRIVESETSDKAAAKPVEDELKL